MQRSNDHATLESLPMEIKLLILCQLDDHSTLRNLTCASSIYAKIEQDKRDEIYTAITIRHVIGHGFDPFRTQDVVAVSFGKSRTLQYSDNDIHEMGAFRNKVIKEFWDAMQKFYKACQQHKSTKSTKALRIPVSICKPLWQIVHAVGWTFHDQLPLGSNGLPDCNGALEVMYLLNQTGFQIGLPHIGYLHGKPAFKYYSSTYGSVFLVAHTSQWTEDFKTRVDKTITRAGICAWSEEWEGGVQGMMIDCAKLLFFGICLVLHEVRARRQEPGTSST